MVKTTHEEAREEAKEVGVEMGKIALSFILYK